MGAVIRGADLQPSIEIAVVFTKSGTFHENFWNNSNGVEVHGDVNEDDVRISRESNPSHQMGYKEWQASAHQGSLADPWIFEVVRSPTANSNLTAAERDRGYSGSYRPAEAAAWTHGIITLSRVSIIVENHFRTLYRNPD